MARVSILSLLMFAATAMLMELALAADHTVGAPNGGWDTSTDLQSWASSQTFSVGDNLVFRYGPSHSVFEVSEGDYDACQAGNPILTDASGNTRIPLNATGSRYFICGTSGHCDQGMKVKIDILAASAPAPPTTTPTPPTTTPTPQPPVPSSSPSSPVPPASSPPTKSPANPAPRSETLNPPSSATINMTGGLAMVSGVLIMMVLSL